MALIIWHDSVREHLLKIFNYNIANVSERVAYAILNAVLSSVQQLERNPQKGAYEPLLEKRKYEYRRLVVRKHYKVIYFLIENEAHIVAVWDARRNPQTLIATIQTK